MKKNLFAAEPRTEQAEAREVREPQALRHLLALPVLLEPAAVVAEHLRLEDI